MRYTITGRNIEVTPGLKAAVEKKIGKLEHFFTPDTEVIVALSAQKDRQKIEVTIPVKGNTIRAEESSTDMYVSIDLVEEVIERQIRRYRKKLIDKKQAALSFSQAFIDEEEAEQEDGDDGDGAEGDFLGAAGGEDGGERNHGTVSGRKRSEGGKRESFYNRRPGRVNGFSRERSPA